MIRFIIPAKRKKILWKFTFHMKVTVYIYSPENLLLHESKSLHLTLQKFTFHRKVTVYIYISQIFIVYFYDSPVLLLKIIFHMYKCSLCIHQVQFILYNTRFIYSHTHITACSWYRNVRRKFRKKMKSSEKLYSLFGEVARGLV